MVELPEGHSGYFSPPSHGLDPSLFDAEHLKPDVREWLWDVLTDSLRKDAGLKITTSSGDTWLYAWLAGSGITYQWSADRGTTGDLDVLYGVDYPTFVTANPEFTTLPDEQIASWLNTVLKAKLWPRTERASIHGGTYEVTFYDNPGVGKDIRSINPYAAYDLRQDKWAVRPPTKDYLTHREFPADWYQAGNSDAGAALSLVRHYTEASGSIQRNSYYQMAKNLFQDIHGGRKKAFTPEGHGYGDFANYRWQAAKRSGAIAGLHHVIDTHEQELRDQEDVLYGGPIEGADVILNRALFNRKPGT